MPGTCGHLVTFSLVETDAGALSSFFRNCGALDVLSRFAAPGAQPASASMVRSGPDPAPRTSLWYPARFPNAGRLSDHGLVRHVRVSGDSEFRSRLAYEPGLVVDEVPVHRRLDVRGVGVHRMERVERWWPRYGRDIGIPAPHPNSAVKLVNRTSYFFARARRTRNASTAD